MKIHKYSVKTTKTALTIWATSKARAAQMVMTAENCPQRSILSVTRIQNGFPVRDDVTAAEYHRPPTPAEIRFGHGATHYKTFDLADCCHKGSRILKRWLVCKHDGLRYYR